MLYEQTTLYSKILPLTSDPLLASLAKPKAARTVHGTVLLFELGLGSVGETSSHSRSKLQQPNLPVPYPVSLLPVFPTGESARRRRRTPRSAGEPPFTMRKEGPNLSVQNVKQRPLLTHPARGLCRADIRHPSLHAETDCPSKAPTRAGLPRGHPPSHESGRPARGCSTTKMLSARKLHLIAGLKVYGLDLRKAELDFYMMRYAAVTGISSLITGMCLVSLIKIKVPEYMRPDEEWFVWQVFSFYCCAAATMCSALFNVVITGFLVVNAQGMALRGGANSLVMSVEILGDHWFLVKTVLIAEVALLACSASLVLWMKLDENKWAPSPAIIITGVMFGVMAMGYQRLTQLAHELHIPSGAIVQGDLSIQPQGGHGKVDMLGEREDAPPPR